VPVAFGLILSGMMFLLVSGLRTFRVAGLAASFLDKWLRGWLSAWVVAFPCVLVLAPLTRRLVARMTR